MCVPALDEDAFERYISKCGKYISRIIYEEKYPELHLSVKAELPRYIFTYCFNITKLDLTALNFFPQQVKILSENFKKIKELKLKLHIEYTYEEQLTKLFEVNKNLEVLELHDMHHICPSLMKLPQHKMKAITLASIYIVHDVFYSVSII